MSCQPLEAFNVCKLQHGVLCVCIMRAFCMCIMCVCVISNATRNDDGWHHRKWQRFVWMIVFTSFRRQNEMRDDVTQALHGNISCNRLGRWLLESVGLVSSDTTTTHNVKVNRVKTATILSLWNFGAIPAVFPLLQNRVVDLANRFQEKLLVWQAHARQLCWVRDLNVVKRILQSTKGGKLAEVRKSFVLFLLEAYLVEHNSRRLEGGVGSLVQPRMV